MTKIYITYTRKIHFKGIWPNNEPITQYEDPNTNDRIKYEWSWLFTVIESPYWNQEIEIVPWKKILDRRMIGFIEYDENIVSPYLLERFLSAYFSDFNFTVKDEAYINAMLLQMYWEIDWVQNITVKDFVFTNNLPVSL